MTYWGQWERLRFLDWPDDGFGNLLEPAGSWYHDHPEAELPEGMVRANPHKHRFVFDRFYAPDQDGALPSR